MPTLLIVDDESEMVLVLKNFFTRNRFTVLSANRGREALAILESNKKIDMMILDMRMPGMKGLEVLKELHEKVIEVPVLVLTGSLNFSHFVEKIGFMGYSEEDVFFKPVNLNDLLTHVNKRLKQSLRNLKGKKYQEE